MKLFNKRQFLQTIATLSGGAILPTKSMESFFQEIEHIQPQELAKDDAFWQKIRSAYGVTKGFYPARKRLLLPGSQGGIGQLHRTHSAGQRRFVRHYMRTRQKSGRG